MAYDLLTELPGYNGWTQELDDLAVQVDKLNRLEAAYERTWSLWSGKMEGSSLSSVTIRASGATPGSEGYPQPDAAFYAILKTELCRELGILNLGSK
jgi:hypothetical protein